MPRRCSVKGCRAKNSTGHPYVSTFKFPNCEIEKSKWVQAIRRPNWSPTQYSGICALHFRNEDFTYNIYDGYKRHRLNKGAIPCIFEGRTIKTEPSIPTTLTSEANWPAVQIQLESMEQIPTPVLSPPAAQNIKLLPPSDYICSFEFLLNHYEQNLDTSNYLIYKNSEKLVFYKLQNSDDVGCNIAIRICISNKLYVKVIVQNIEIFSADLTLLPRNMKISKWSQIRHILTKYRDECYEINENREHLLNRSLHYLMKVREVDKDFVHMEKLDLIINQIELLNNSRPRYTPDTIVFAYLLYAHSPSTYNIIKKFLLLPHPSYLSQISSDSNVFINDEKIEDYLNRSNKKVVNEREKYVALTIDEIYSESGVPYNRCNKNISEELKQPTTTTVIARTIMVFMIKSIYGNLKKLVRISPIPRRTDEVLYELTKLVIQYVQNLNFKVLIIITDNTKIYHDMFTKFCSTKNYFVNPAFPELKIFYHYDSVSLFKNIRNDWMNLKTPKKTFIYPDFDDYSIKKASFSNFNVLYAKSKNSPAPTTTATAANAITIAKSLLKLNDKMLNLSKLDKDNCQLVENLFDDTTIAALYQYSAMKDTADFCTIINKWWNIIQNLQIKTLKDDNFVFLEKFLIWLDVWSSSSSDSGSLTECTLNGLKNSTQSLIDLITFIFNQCKIDHIYIRKLQIADFSGRYGLEPKN